MLSRLFIAALWSPAGKGLTAWLLLVMFIVFLLLSHVVSWVKCGTWLHRFLIFAIFLTLYFDQTLCHKDFSDIVHTVYTGIYNFIFLTEWVKKTSMRIWYYGIIRSSQKWFGKWYMGWNYQSKDKTLPLCVIFSVQCIFKKNNVIITLLLLPSCTSWWIFYIAEKQQQHASQILH